MERRRKAAYTEMHHDSLGVSRGSEVGKVSDSGSGADAMDMGRKRIDNDDERTD